MLPIFLLFTNFSLLSPLIPFLLSFHTSFYLTLQFSISLQLPPPPISPSGLSSRYPRSSFFPLDIFSILNIISPYLIYIFFHFRPSYFFPTTFPPGSHSFRVPCSTSIFCGHFQFSSPWAWRPLASMTLNILFQCIFRFVLRVLINSSSISIVLSSHSLLYSFPIKILLSQGLPNLFLVDYQSPPSSMVSSSFPTRREFLREILYKNIAIIAIQHSKMYVVDTFGDFSHTVEWNSLKSGWQISLCIGNMYIYYLELPVCRVVITIQYGKNRHTVY